MFEHHKKSPWFAEKYDPAPEFANLRLRVRKEGWKGRIDAFLLDLESSKFDPDSQESTQQSSPTVDNSTNGEQGGDTNGAGDEGKVNGADDEMQFAMDGDEDAGDPDATKPESNGKSLPQDARRMLNRGEEISTMPEGNQVTIRTIPPDIGRMKLEDVRLLPRSSNAKNMLTYSIGTLQDARVQVPGAWGSYAEAKLLQGWLDTFQRRCRYVGCHE